MELKRVFLCSCGWLVNTQWQPIPSPPPAEELHGWRPGNEAKQPGGQTGFWEQLPLSSSPVSVIWIGMRSTGHTSTLPCCSTQTRTWPQAVKRPSKPSPVQRRSYLEGDSSHLWLYTIVAVFCVEVMKQVWAIHKIFLYNVQIIMVYKWDITVTFRTIMAPVQWSISLIWTYRLSLKLNFCELYNVS